MLSHATLLMYVYQFTKKLLDRGFDALLALTYNDDAVFGVAHAGYCILLQHQQHYFIACIYVTTV